MSNIHPNDLSKLGTAFLEIREELLEMERRKSLSNTLCGPGDFHTNDITELTGAQVLHDINWGLYYKLKKLGLSEVDDE